MSVKEKLELRKRSHLEIAMSAAVAAGLARTEAEARRNMEEILEKDALRLKDKWIRERFGGVKGWHCFLRTFGFEERLVVQKVDK